MLKQRLRALLRALPGAQAGDARAVHKARVASRRVREALPILAAEAARRRKLQRRVESITRTLGPVRELDVSLGLTDDLERELPGSAAALRTLRHNIQAERRLSGGRLIGRLEKLDRRRLASRTERVLAEAGSESVELTAAAVLLIRLTRRTDELRAAIDAAGPLYVPDAIHAVRIAAKKVRYALELARDLRWLRTRSALSRLVRMQETLGRLNDLQVLIHRADALRAGLPPRAADARALTALIADLEVSCRELHARYLAGRQGLLDAVDRALAEVGVRASEVADDRVSAR